MNYTKLFSVVGVIAVAGAAIYFARRRLQQSATQDTRGVTSAGTAGIAQGAVTRTSPIKASDTAFVAPASTLDLLAKIGGKIGARVPSTVLPVTTNKLQPFNNPASAGAAFTSPLRTDYTTSSYARF
jgi:hypothetical protein